MLVRTCVVGFVFALVVGCTALTPPDDLASGDSTEEELHGGCRLICPKCHPGEVCPLIACREDCHAHTGACDAQCTTSAECVHYADGIGDCCGACLPATAPKPATIACLIPCQTPITCPCVLGKCTATPVGSLSSQ